MPQQSSPDYFGFGIRFAVGTRLAVGTLFGVLLALFFGLGSVTTSLGTFWLITLLVGLMMGLLTGLFGYRLLKLLLKCF